MKIYLCLLVLWASVALARDADQPEALWLYESDHNPEELQFLFRAPDPGDEIQIYPNPLGGMTIINPDEQRMDCFQIPLRNGWKCRLD
jgi:hypothetical protein